MLPLDGAYRVEVETSSGDLVHYHKHRSHGTIEVDDPKHRKWLQAEGLAVPANEGGPTAHLRGYQCPCGRRNFIKTCGKCGSDQGVRI